MRDLGSRHGALLDGRPIPRDGVLVTLRAVLAIGKARIAISRASVPSPGSDPAPPPGLRLDQVLGRGESGVVWAAWQEPPGRRVAVKVLAPRASKTLLARARREALLGARLDHPAIPRVFDAVVRDGRLHVIRELVVGHALTDDLGKGAVPWRRAATIGATIAGALAHAHERGVVHRNVAPGNILIDDATGRAMLVDFGEARDAALRPSLDGVKRLTKTDDQLGSLSYVAPEELEDARRAGPKANVYGLAAVLYHMLSGVRPFAGVLPDDYLRDIVSKGPSPLATLAPGVPPKLEKLVTRALAVYPDERPWALDLGRALEALA